ncbi:hypothetical protein NLU13_4609 [Sarocladium strictum]|uniref:BRCT domain-containing protein n=1 Tax=Sarocladium strictum TaxID=5046 RepID=A0AA39GK01_SARSR|nr:hypothetical protein NLU13_4609 [Sarocladium strictum]
MDTSTSSPRSRREIDHSAPLKDIVVCCTSIPTEGRTIISQRVAELGGIHKYDLTPDVTHLIVGDYDTPKYRHVARERPDIKAMDASWIVAVAELWRNGDDDFDFDALERKHQLKPFERCGSMPESLAGDGSPRQGLLISLTGFGEARDGIADKITANGATYTPDLTKQCTHLIVHQPEGKKFTAAKQWGVHTVSLQWLEQSLERGLILEEPKFDPLLPFEEQGLGAWIKKDPRRTSLGKRSRSGAAGPGEEVKGPRKLRKTASMKLNSQRDGLWGDILKRPDSKDNTNAEESNSALGPDRAPPGAAKTQGEAQRISLPVPQGVFGHSTFFIHGFPSQRAQILEQTIASLEGSIVSSLSALSKSLDSSFRFLIVPQSSQPDTHPTLPDGDIHIITEFYIEKCLHNKQFFDPRDHVIGRPFPAFPIPELAAMTICTAAFTGIELSQVARSVTQIGATFAEEFRPSASVLVCRSLAGTRKEKLKCALAWGVPVVSAEWLWECISTGYRVPFKEFTFTELKKRGSLGDGEDHKSSSSAPAPAASKSTTSKPPTVDRSGFDADDVSGRLKQALRRNTTTKQESTTSADFHTARTNPIPTRDTDSSLTELSSASLNKSPSPTKVDTSTNPFRSKSDPIPRQKENTVSTRAPSAPPADTAPLGDANEEAAQHQALLTSRLASLVDTSASVGSPSFHASADEPKPRRRQLLGRATSNVSATSSNANANPSVTPAVAPSDGAVAFGGDENSVAGDLEGQDEAVYDNPHPGTQLAYGDPEAQGVKAQIISRMAGENTKVIARTGGGALDTAVGGRSLRKR